MQAIRIAVAGANGLVGSALCRHLSSLGVSHTPLCRPGCNNPPANANPVNFESADDLHAGLKGNDCLIHLIAKTHSPDESRLAKEYYLINVELTRRLAVAAAKAGVRRLVYLSSIKVNGESTGDKPFHHTDTPNPAGPYGESKMAAEQELHRFCSANNMELVVLRAPLVYAPNAKGNIAALKRALHKGIPLPLARIDNCRSIIDLPTLCEQLYLCATLPETAGKTLLACSESLSTPGLIRKLADDEGLTPRMFHLPLKLLELGARLIHKKEQWQKLAGDLVIDNSYTLELLRQKYRQ